jgi:hypothetical protein|nr:MAG TPA: hypothetical protein [Caudoviricetes sp.]
MKVKISTFSIDINDQAIKQAKNKESFIKDTVKSLMWIGIDEKSITEVVTDAYESVRPPKKKSESAI